MKQSSLCWDIYRFIFGRESVLAVSRMHWLLFSTLLLTVYSDLEELHELNIIYINLEHRVDRRNEFLNLFSSGDIFSSHKKPLLHRVPGVNGQNSSETLSFLSCELKSIAGLAEGEEDLDVWDGSSRRPHPSTMSSMWRGALGCSLAHLLAA